MIRSFLGIVLLLFVISGFEWHLGVDPESYVNEYNDRKSSFQKTIIDNEVQYSFSFIPQELRIIQQYRKGLIEQDEVEKRLKQKETSYEFMLQIEIPENGNQEFLKYQADSISYESRVEYFAFGFSNDIIVNFDNSTDQKISGYSFERNFGASPKGTISFYIDVPDKTEKITIQFNDQVYGSQTQKVTFDLNDIKALPQLKKVTKWKNTRK